MKLSYVKTAEKLFLVLFSLLAALKILLVGFDVDEQYAVAMSFRLLRGDFPILDMWEPHQTSGFLCALLMAPYLALTKSTTGIFLYLRVCGLLIHFGVFLLLRRFLRQTLERVCDGNREYIGLYASLIACIYFFTLPKLMFLPEFSNLQVWFLMPAIICLIRYYMPVSGNSGHTDRFPLSYLILAGFCIMLEVLSYPSTVFVFFFCVYYMIRFRRPRDLARTVKELAAFVLPCVLGALIFCIYLLSSLSLGQLFELLPIVTSDGSHFYSFAEKIVSNLQSLRELLLFAVIYGAVSTLAFFFLRKRKSAGSQPGFLQWTMLFLMITLLGQLLLWVAGDRYPNYPHAEYFFLPVLTLFLVIRSKETTGPLFAFSFVVPLIAFGSILLFTNHPLIVSAPFLGACTVGCLVLLGTHILTDKGISGMQGPLKFLLTLWAGTLLFGNLFLIRTTGGQHYTIFAPVSLMRQGPAIGIVADAYTVMRYNDGAALLAEYIPSGAKVFYAGSSNAIYLQEDVEICTPSTISTPTYDDKVSQYFLLHPDKTPEYLICDKGLVDLSSDSWLTDYIRTACEEIPIADDEFFIIYNVLTH